MGKQFSKKHMNKFSLTMLILLVLVIVSGVGVILYYVQPSEQKVVEQPSETGNQLIENDIDTSDWLTYRNEELGFEFKYPGDIYILDTLGSHDRDKFSDSSEEQLHISNEEIVYDEFLNGYNSLITIKRGQGLDDRLEVIESYQLLINNTRGEYFISISSEKRPTFPEVEVITVDFEKPEIVLQTSYFVDARENKLNEIVGQILSNFVLIGR